MWSEVLIIFDGHGPNGSIRHTTTKADGKLEIDLSGHDEVTVINISDLTAPLADKVDKKGLFPKREVAKLLNMTPRTIQYYTDLDLVVPEENPRGRGVTRKYSWQNMFQLLLVKKLATCGYDLTTIKKLMSHPLFGMRVNRGVWAD